MIITCNNNEIDGSDDRVRLFDPAKSSDVKGVFETMRTYDGEIFRLDDHLQRLVHSAEIIDLKLPQLIETIREWVLEVLEKCDFRPARLKLVVTEKDVLIECVPLEIDTNIYDGVKVITVSLERKNPEAKSLDYRQNYEAHEKAVKQGCYDALLVDNDGNVKEGAYANLFWVKDGKFYTCDEAVLKGITRQVVIENSECEFDEISLQELLKSDEVFLTQTTREIIPVTEIDGEKIGDGKVGLHTSHIHKLCFP
jgi:branched-chain amino acid aminotransferase